MSLGKIRILPITEFLILSFSTLYFFRSEFAETRTDNWERDKNNIPRVSGDSESIFFGNTVFTETKNRITEKKSVLIDCV